MGAHGGAPAMPVSAHTAARIRGDPGRRAGRAHRATASGRQAVRLSGDHTWQHADQDRVHTEQDTFPQRTRCGAVSRRYARTTDSALHAHRRPASGTRRVQRLQAPPVRTEGNAPERLRTERSSRRAQRTARTHRVRRGRRAVRHPASRRDGHLQTGAECGAPHEPASTRRAQRPRESCAGREQNAPVRRLTARAAPRSTPLGTGNPIRPRSDNLPTASSTTSNRSIDPPIATLAIPSEGHAADRPYPDSRYVPDDALRTALELELAEGCAFPRRDVGGDRSTACRRAMNQNRRLALTDLMDTAARRKANAVIGVDIAGGPYLLLCRIGQALRSDAVPPGTSATVSRARRTCAAATACSRSARTAETDASCARATSADSTACAARTRSRA